jgi:signal transduction histidine kinase
VSQLPFAIAASQASAEMLNTMLDFSRIEAGVVQPQVVSFHLQPLLNKIEREFARQADSDGYIVKPFTGLVLRQKIDAILQRRAIA